MDVYLEIMRDVSYDPYFKIKFSYKGKGIDIEKGYVEIIRRAPKPQITYDSDTEKFLGIIDKPAFELELMNAVLQFMISKRSAMQVHR